MSEKISGVNVRLKRAYESPLRRRRHARADRPALAPLGQEGGRGNQLLSEGVGAKYGTAQMVRTRSGPLGRVSPALHGEGS